MNVKTRNTYIQKIEKFLFNFSPMIIGAVFLIVELGAVLFFDKKILQLETIFIMAVVAFSLGVSLNAIIHRIILACNCRAYQEEQKVYMQSLRDNIPLALQLSCEYQTYLHVPTQTSIENIFPETTDTLSSENITPKNPEIIPEIEINYNLPRAAFYRGDNVFNEDNA